MAGFENFTHLTPNHFYGVRTLQEIASVNVIGRICANNTRDGPKQILEKLQQTNIPTALIEKAKQLIGPITFAVQSWISSEYDSYGFHLTMGFPEFVSQHGLHYKWCGIIDYEKMARRIFKDERFGVVGRFQVACNYCMVAEVHAIWQTMSEDERENVTEVSKLVRFWKYSLNGELAVLIHGTIFRTEKEYGLSAASENGNLSAIEYFWRQMREEEISNRKIQHADRAFYRTSFKDSYRMVIILPFFISRMSREEQFELSVNAISRVIVCLLMSPWKELFIPMFDFALSSFTANRPARLFRKNCLTILVNALTLITNYNFAHILEFGVVPHIWANLGRPERDDFLRTFTMNLRSLFCSKSSYCTNTILEGVGDDILRSIAVSDECCKFLYEQIRAERVDVVKFTLNKLLKRDLREMRKLENKVCRYVVDLNDAKVDDCSESELKMMSVTFIMSRLEKVTGELLSEAPSTN